MDIADVLFDGFVQDDVGQLDDRRVRIFELLGIYGGFSAFLDENGVLRSWQGSAVTLFGVANAVERRKR